MMSFLIAEPREALAASTIKTTSSCALVKMKQPKCACAILETFSESATMWKRLGTRAFQLHTDRCPYLLFCWFDDRVVDVALESRGLWIDSHSRHKLS